MFCCWTQSNLSLITYHKASTWHTKKAEFTHVYDNPHEVGPAFTRCDIGRYGFCPRPCWEWQSKNINKKTASRQDPENLNHARVCGIICFQGTELHNPLNTDYLRFHCVPLDGDSSSLLRGGKHLMGNVFSEEENYQIIEYWEVAAASCNYNNLLNRKYRK